MCCLLPCLLPLSLSLFLNVISWHSYGRSNIPPLTIYTICRAVQFLCRNGEGVLPQWFVEMEYNRYNFITFNTFDMEKGSYFALSIVFYTQIFNNTFSDVHKIECEYVSAYTGAVVRIESSPQCHQFHIVWWALFPLSIERQPNDMFVLMLMLKSISAPFAER